MINLDNTLVKKLKILEILISAVSYGAFRISPFWTDFDGNSRGKLKPLYPPPDEFDDWIENARQIWAIVKEAQPQRLQIICAMALIPKNYE